jgi:hypothetical protein
MVRDWYSVPAIPDQTLRRVFGERTPDPAVELVALVVEYWVTSAPMSPRLTRDKVLEVARGRIDARNIYDLISLLAKRGFVEAFFDLTMPHIDADGAFRAWLEANDVGIDTIRFYASWNGISPDLFLKGFAFGVAESFATVVVDLGRMVKLIGDLQQSQFRTLVLLTTDFDEGISSLRGQAVVVGQVFDGLLKQLDPTELPAKVTDTWKSWNEEFRKHLEKLDPFAAGRLLGKIGGDLWQLLTGLLALVKLLRIGIRLALRYAPLLLGSVRRAATQVVVIVRELARALTAIGKTVIDGLHKIGLGVLRTLFPPEILRALVKEGRVFLMHHELTLMPIFEPAYAQAFGSSLGMRTQLGALISKDGKPVLMAAMSETLPASASAHPEAPLDDIIDQLDELLHDPDGKITPANVDKLNVKAAAQALLEQRLDTKLKALVQTTAWETFLEMRKSGRRFYPNELGQQIHSAMAARLAGDVAEAAPGTLVQTEKSMRTMVKTIAVTEPSAVALNNANRVMDETVGQMLARRPEILDILGVEKKASSRTQEALTKAMSEEFGWNTSTTVGDLKSDALIADVHTRNVVNVDWTSSTRMRKFEEVWKQVADDLGGKFGGDWDLLAEAYKKAGKGPVPASVKNGLDALARHAVRETVVRKVALEEVLGKLWNVRSHEMTYDSMKKLFDREKAAREKAARLLSAAPAP